MNIVIPAAGHGTRFRQAGYDLPKPLVDVVGKPMIQRVIENVTPKIRHRVVVICLSEHGLFVDGTELIELNTPTAGAVETILKAQGFIDNSPLLIANCDQLCDFNTDQFIAEASRRDGGVITFKSAKPHHSYVKTNIYGAITEIAEKEVISNKAVAGVYFFTHGDDFLRAAHKVIRNNERTKGEYYVSSVIRQMVNGGKHLISFDAPTAILGTPEELQLFEMAVKVGRRI